MHIWQNYNPHPLTGMNINRSDKRIGSRNFNPHPCNGGELPFAVACVGNPKFQPSSPYGDEQLSVEPKAMPTIFQPTPPHGDEPDFFLHSRSLLFISTHTPAWGMNNFDQAQTVIFRNFNPHPRMEMNAILLNSIKPFLQFQPTPRMGMNKRLEL